MKYTVVWHRSAESELAEAWLAADDRDDISRAASAIDADLQQEPLSQGESRGGQRRIHFVAPLGVTFEVYPADRLVRVLHVWQYQ